MVRTGSDADDHASTSQPIAGGAVRERVRVPGLVAAGVWAVALVVGLVALVLGHLPVAAVALVVAVMAPWFGVAYIAHSQRGVSGRTPGPRGTHTHAAAAFPTGWRGRRLSAR
ncbi:hypothetical protein [Mycobacterium decipiens]|uniref:Uncharacterized protein n=1 Tax=Mycobacterium decipiens TaxID=1430326 RepID=A0A1X2LTH0_9MYCO|nr:hypothetical protein [Mycobacterium decipiens]OSC40191.1 hypothetical protein B8W66_13935 [Mycobacterium decipiens]